MSQENRRVEVSHYRNYLNETLVALHAEHHRPSQVLLNRAEAEQLLSDLRAVLCTDALERTVDP